MRLDAALALALTRLSSAADLLRARLDVENDGRVRSHISRQLRVVEEAIGLPPTQPSAEDSDRAAKDGRKPETKPAAKTESKPVQKR